ncbi:hypothetical protein WA026_005611 [Henosepilachna vigintioctopunctata]|uniref:Uncharacterized protein n=1 Tax=Henosepilachna vigintioctopunctata TaxID=420089 RepID=A0AAW1U2A3_9CUCU
MVKQVLILSGLILCLAATGYAAALGVYLGTGEIKEIEGLLSFLGTSNPKTQKPGTKSKLNQSIVVSS